MSKLHPSRAARRMQCPGSRYLEENYGVNHEHTSSNEGKLAHELAADMLSSREYNSENYTEEMKDGAFLYANTIKEDHNRPSSFELQIEKNLEINNIHPNCEGVPDCWFYNLNERTVYIYEYKFRYTYIEVFENWQLLEYAAGIYNLLRDDVIVEKFVLGIIQPRNYGVHNKINRWEIKIERIKEYFDRLKESESKASQDNIYTKTGSECKNCTARLSCDALRKAITEIIDTVEMDNIPRQLTNEELSFEMRYIKKYIILLEARFTSLQQESEYKIRHGELIPYFTLQAVSSRLVWKKPKEIKIIADLLGVNITKPDMLITPLQAIKAGLSEDLVNKYAERTEGGLKLIEQDELFSKKLFNNNQGD